MKKFWLIFALVVIIAAQVTFIYSFRNISAYSSVDWVLKYVGKVRFPKF